jgi:hypothetical protein
MDMGLPLEGEEGYIADPAAGICASACVCVDVYV